MPEASGRGTTVTEVLGWLGAVSVCCAYFAQVLWQRPPSHVWNGIGGAALFLSATAAGARPSAFVNALWTIIALWGWTSSRRLLQSPELPQDRGRDAA